jgi:hypothetical protein
MAKKKADRSAQIDSRGSTEGTSYVEESRGFALSVIAILPLLLLYQLGIVQRGSPTRNLAEVWITGPLSLLGVEGATVVNVLVLAGLAFALCKVMKTGAITFGFLGIIVVESAFYALFMFVAVTFVTDYIHSEMTKHLALSMAPSTSLLLAVGAGVYEELLFRFCLIGLGGLLLHKVFMWNKPLTYAFLLLGSSVLFSAAHHVSGGGESFDGFVFLFRALCGVVLGVVFLCRGLGVAVWTHAIYNVMVLLAG